MAVDDFDVAIGAMQPPTFTYEDRARLDRLESALQDAIDTYEKLPEVCRERTCDYFSDYLAKGPRHLSHAGYHAARAKLAEETAKAKSVLATSNSFAEGALVFLFEDLERRFRIIQECKRLVRDGWGEHD